MKLTKEQQLKLDDLYLELDKFDKDVSLAMKAVKACQERYDLKSVETAKYLRSISRDFKVVV